MKKKVLTAVIAAALMTSTFAFNVSAAKEDYLASFCATLPVAQISGDAYSYAEVSKAQAIEFTPGIIGGSIYDIDNDGASELVTVYVDKAKSQSAAQIGTALLSARVQVYELNITKTELSSESEDVVFLSSLSDGGGLEVLTKDNAVAIQGAVQNNTEGDGVSQNIAAYTYNGNDLVKKASFTFTGSMMDLQENAADAKKFDSVGFSGIANQLTTNSNPYFNLGEEQGLNIADAQSDASKLAAVSVENNKSTITATDEQAIKDALTVTVKVEEVSSVDAGAPEVEATEDVAVEAVDTAEVEATDVEEEVADVDVDVTDIDAVEDADVDAEYDFGDDAITPDINIEDIDFSDFDANQFDVNGIDFSSMDTYEEKAAFLEDMKVRYLGFIDGIEEKYGVFMDEEARTKFGQVRDFVNNWSVEKLEIVGSLTPAQLDAFQKLAQDDPESVMDLFKLSDEAFEDALIAKLNTVAPETAAKAPTENSPKTGDSTNAAVAVAVSFLAMGMFLFASKKVRNVQ
ncbi:MAG: hypothetical protein IJS61_01475 [Firmicutes bacterium]|nr:hypothetical protein [Bacillota bacterium]